MAPEEQPHVNGRQIPISEAIREAQAGFRDLLRSELHLTAVELKSSALSLGHRSKLLVAFGALAVWAVLPLTAFLIIGLGVLLGERYWLSSLLLAALALAVGASGVLRQIRGAKDEDLSMRRTRRTINRKLRRVV